MVCGYVGAMATDWCKMGVCLILHSMVLTGLGLWAIEQFLLLFLLLADPLSTRFGKVFHGSEFS